MSVSEDEDDSLGDNEKGDVGEGFERSCVGGSGYCVCVEGRIWGSGYCVCVQCMMLCGE